MLDIKFIRENPGIVKADLNKRGDDEKLGWVDDLLDKDGEYRKLLAEVQKLRHRRNELSAEVNSLKKQDKDISSQIKEARELPEKIKASDDKINELKNKIDFYLMRIPNILHKSVPAGKDDSENKVVRKWGEIKKPSFELKPHGELMEELGIGDFKRATKIAGAGFYYLRGDLAILNIALQRFAIDFLVKKGFTLVEPPLMMNKKAYEGVTDMADFENVMYKIDNEELYLIATSEHPMGAMFMCEVVKEEALPVRFCGVSPCFRKEIGSHGIDTRGLFRVHQFSKIEQFVFCRPEDSWKIHEELIENAETLFKKLKLPYRIVNICTGDIGTVAAKKYDIEVWMPREQKYREVVSCSNCTSYQAVRLNIRYEKKDGTREFLHTLNSTAIATSRALRAILENCQQKDGSIKVPAALQPYTGFKVIQAAAKKAKNS